MFPLAARSARSALRETPAGSPPGVTKWPSGGRNRLRLGYPPRAVCPRTIMEYAPRQRHWTPLSPPGGTMADMARRTATPPPPEDFEENIVDIDVAEEMRGSYLEYAYSVIYQRALPDARTG